MTNSDIYWVDITFDWCVKLLYLIADILGFTYEEINIWLFVIISPLFFFYIYFFKLLFLQKNKKA